MRIIIFAKILKSFYLNISFNHILFYGGLRGLAFRVTCAVNLGSYSTATVGLSEMLIVGAYFLSNFTFVTVISG